MIPYDIRPCRLADLRQLALTMRAEDRGEIDAAGLLPRHLLPRLWRASLDPKVAFVDGEVAVAWGDAAPVLARHGSMWMFTTKAVERVPLAFFREARSEIQRRLIVRASLAADVRADYAKAIRFFSMLGFEIGGAFPVGPYGVLYRRMTIRTEQRKAA